MKIKLILAATAMFIMSCAPAVKVNAVMEQVFPPRMAVIYTKSMQRIILHTSEDYKTIYIDYFGDDVKLCIEIPSYRCITTIEFQNIMKGFSRANDGN